MESNNQKKKQSRKEEGPLTLPPSPTVLKLLGQGKHQMLKEELGRTRYMNKNIYLHKGLHEHFFLCTSHAVFWVFYHK